MSRRPTDTRAIMDDRGTKRGVPRPKLWSEAPVRTKPPRVITFFPDICVDVHVPAVWEQVSFRVWYDNPASVDSDLISITGGSDALRDESNGSYITIPTTTDLSRHYIWPLNWGYCYRDWYERSTVSATGDLLFEGLDQDTIDFWDGQSTGALQGEIVSSKTHIVGKSTTAHAFVITNNQWMGYPRVRSGSSPVFNEGGCFTGVPANVAPLANDSMADFGTSTSEVVWSYTAPGGPGTGSDIDLGQINETWMRTWGISNSIEDAPCEYWYPGTPPYDTDPAYFWTMDAYNDPPGAPAVVYGAYTDVTVRYIAVPAYSILCPVVVPPDLYPGCDQYTNFTTDGGGAQ